MDVIVHSHPFPHAVLDDFWNDDQLDRVRAEFPSPRDPGWKRYKNDNEGKLEGPPHLWGPETKKLFRSMADLASNLGSLFNIENLSMETVGGGYHLIPPGGRLQVHTDFNRSPDTGLYRRLNMIIYLNKDWHDTGGNLELWSQDEILCIAPEFNRTVIFETSDHSWHGHPISASRWRASIAAYFFSPDPPPGYAGDHSTVWWE
jgi:hypothetical protein